MLPSLSTRRGSGNTATRAPTNNDLGNTTTYTTSSAQTSTITPNYQQPPASPRITQTPPSSYSASYTTKETYHPPSSPSSTSGGYGPRTPSRLRFKSTTPSSSSASNIGPGGRYRLNSFEEEETDQVVGYGGDDGQRNDQGKVPASSKLRRGDALSSGTSLVHGVPNISSPTNFRHVAGSGITAAVSDTTTISPTRPIRHTSSPNTHNQNTDSSNTDMSQPKFTHSSSLPNTRHTREQENVTQASGVDEFGRVPAAGTMAARTWSASSSGHGHGVGGNRYQVAAEASNGEEALNVLGSPLSPTSFQGQRPQQLEHQQYRSEPSPGSTSHQQQTTFSDVASPSAHSSTVTWSQTSPFGNEDTRSPPVAYNGARSASSSVSGPSGIPSGASTQLHTPRTPNLSTSGGQLYQSFEGEGGKYKDDVSQHLRQLSLQGPPSTPSNSKLQYSTPQQPRVVGMQQQVKPRGSSEGWDKEKRRAGWFANVARSTIGVGVGRRQSEEEDIEEEDTARWGERRKMSDPTAVSAAAGRRGSSPIDESAVTEEEETTGASVLRKKSIQRMRSLVGAKQPRVAPEEAASTGAASGGAEPSGSSLGSFLRKHSFTSSTSRRPNMRAGGNGESLSPVRPTGLQISAPIGVPIKATATQAGSHNVREEDTQNEMHPDVSARPTTPSYIRQTPPASTAPVSQAFPTNANTTAAQQQSGFPTPLSPPRRVSPDENPTWSTPRAQRKQPPKYVPSTPSNTSQSFQSSTASYPSRMEQGLSSAYLNPNQNIQVHDWSKVPMQGRRSDDSERRLDQDALPSTPQRSAVQTRPGRIIPPPLSLHQALGASLQQPYELASGADADTEDAEDQSSILDYNDVVIERAERVMTPSRVRKEDRDAPSTPEAPPTPSNRLMPSPMTSSDITQQVVDISVSCRGQDEGGNPSDEYEEFSWNVVIRRKRRALDSVSTTESVSPSTSPIQLSSVPTRTVVPPTASSINLSLNLHQPAGKLVFISIPPAVDIPSVGRRISHSAAYGPAISKFANAKIERSPSPSPASSRQFASGHALLSPKTTSFSPARTNPSFNKASLVPPPSESDESLDEAHESPQTALVNTGFAYPTGQQAGQQLHAATSPPASPRDLMMRRRKASLQGGVLYTRGL